MNSNYLMPTYRRLTVSFDRGQGVWLWDTRGRKYLDALSGIAVTGLGHCHPEVSAAISKQAATLIHTSNLYHIPLQQQLAEKLCTIANMEQAFFCNSGAEAVESAIKLARLHGHQRGCDKPAIVVMEEAFHGRTMATLSATGNPKVQQGFEPLVSGFIRSRYGDLEALQQLATSRDDITAVLIEPVQGEGGINIAASAYLQGLRALCDQYGWLLIFDEIQSGIGRTGRWFACQHSDVLPDVITTAKGLGNGMPIAACLSRGPARDVFQSGNHGSTFGGNPLACAAALATLAVMEQQDIPALAATTGAWLLQACKTRLSALPAVREIRGLGMMLGIELDRPCTELVTKALERQLLINVTADKVIRLLPPLIMQQPQARQLMDILQSLIEDFTAGCC